ncbi:MAG: OmpH family outer membrane protein [Saprospiraceae bacterium]|nr:MAG: outer membrane chaperone Skp [Bacteroidetes bacterium OLB9]MCO6463790.1 OmpH family outer membrane protein [Saprospiraceae bacterium]MCZ2338826.1 OmpH family outer membrane protein [Chitinophagales bacterium]
MKLNFLSIALMMALAVTVNAQKFGYIDTQELLSQMSEMKLADNQLQQYQNELMAKRGEMTIKFEDEYKAYLNEANGGTLSKVQMQQREEALVAKQEEIRSYETEMQQKIIAKREELLKPIIDKVQLEIDKLGKEQGYTMIFDASAGMILHAAESENLMSTLKTRLGVN